MTDYLIAVKFNFRQSLTANFARLKADGVYYPAPDYSFLFNPLMGGGPSARANGPDANESGVYEQIAYMYVSWRDLEPVKGEINFENVRVWNSTYPFSTGPNAGQSMIAYQKAGVYVNLRVIMDYPQAGSGGYQALRNREIADIPDWLIEEMRANPINPRTGQPYGRPAGLTTTQRTQNQRDVGWFPDENWGIEGVWYYSLPDISGGMGLAPRYDHHILIENHERFIQAVAKEIATPGSPWQAVANLQLGSLGHWGEWHNWPVGDSGTFASASVASQYVQHYLDAFADNDNVHIAMRYANWIGSSNHMGLFHDEHGHRSTYEQINTVNGLNLNTSDGAGGPGHNTGATTISYNRNANMGNDLGWTSARYNDAAVNPTFWMTSWSGGEYGDQSSPRSGTNNGHDRAVHDTGALQTGTYWINVMNTIGGFRWSNATTLAPRCPRPGFTEDSASVFNANVQAAYKNNDALYDNMGYRFFIEEFAIDGELKRGSTVNVSMTVKNKGVAPFYRPWPLEISFIDGEGAVAGRYIVPVEDVDIRKWMPRHRAYSNARNPLTGELNVFVPAFEGRSNAQFPVEIPDSIPNEAYTLAIGILDPFLGDLKPAIEFHNMGRRDDKRLLLEPFKVVVQITSIRIDALSITTVARGETYNFNLNLNAGASSENVIWSLADPSLGYADGGGNITIFDKTGNVRLTATDPDSGLSHSITLRIAA